MRFDTHGQSINEIIRYVKEALAYYIENDFIWKLQVDTYNREIERYGVKTMEFTESAFEIDSNYVIKALSVFKNDTGYYLPLLFIREVDSILNGFNADLSFKLHLLESLKNSYG